MVSKSSETASESSETIRNHPGSYPANHPNPSSYVYRHRKDRMADRPDDPVRMGIGEMRVFGKEGKYD
jgi:hypothetical protein